MGVFESILVGLIVAAAAVATAISLWRSLTGRGRSQCASCPMRSDCTARAAQTPHETPHA